MCCHLEIVSTLCCVFFFVFFKQKTAYEIKECDWSSDVCSSDLLWPCEAKPVCFCLRRGDFSARGGRAVPTARVCRRERCEEQDHLSGNEEGRRCRRLLRHQSA